MRILISVHAHIPTLIICVCVSVCVFSLRPSGFVFGSNGRGTLSRSTKTQCPQKFWHSPMQTHRARTHANPRPVTPPDTPPATPATGSYNPQGDVTGTEHVPPTPTAAHQEGGKNRHRSHNNNGGTQRAQAWRDSVQNNQHETTPCVHRIRRFSPHIGGPA